MGSGLLLLVLVGAWLAVLVPLGLRSYDAAAQRSGERIGDAVRVLARRRGAARSPRSRPEAPVVDEQPRAARLPVPAAVRRRRVLLVLVVLAVNTALAGVPGPAYLFVVAGALALLAALFLMHCRRLVLRRRPAPPVLVDLEAPTEEIAPPGPAPVGGTRWQPVPVPLPTYLRHAGSAAAEPASVDVAGSQEWGERDPILDRRRAVGGW